MDLALGYNGIKQVLAVLKYLLAGVLVVTAIAFLLYRGFQQPWYLYVDELKGKQESLEGKKIRVSGELVPESIKEIDGKTEFVLAWGGEELKVIYKSFVPVEFQRRGNIVVEGVYRQGVLYGELLVGAHGRVYLPRK